MPLPEGEIIVDDELEVLEEAELPTKTYFVDFKKGRCHGMVDGLKAMEQAIFKVLNTVRFEHLIYSDDYGFEPIIGQDRLFVEIDLPRRIEEALLQDERITAVEDIEMDFVDNKVLVHFTAETLYGDVKVLREVDIDV